MSLEVAGYNNVPHTLVGTISPARFKKESSMALRNFVLTDQSNPSNAITPRNPTP